jgi:hypothetical protein
MGARRFVVLAFAVAGLALGAQASLAAPPGVSVSFTIPAGQCPQLGNGVAVTGEGLIREVLHGGGTFTQFASGTATDTNGNTYKFNYHLTISEKDNRALFTDHFNLVGGPETIRAHFVARFDQNGVFFNEHGDPVADTVTFAAVCDPI